MSFKLNKKAIENYSNTLSGLILNQAFYTRDFLGGNELSKLTETPQINILILKILFEKWNKEAEKLRSKYFDFTHPDVAHALQLFKNRLSHHIKIDVETFTPLLEEAIKDTLSLIFEPRSAVIKLFLQNSSNYKEQLKFLKVHPQLVKTLLEIKGASLEELHAVVNAWENFTKPEEILEQTSKIHKGIIEDFVLDEVDQTIILPKKTEKPLSAEEIKTVNDAFSEDKPLAQNLASQFQDKQKITSLQAGISINQRFVFIKELFNGEVEAYNQFILELDTMDSFHEADSFIKNEIVSHYNWQEKETAQQEFYQLLIRKY